MIRLKYNLPDGFLCEETRSGYTVTTKMKKVWAIQMDLLQELMRVCKEHDITMFMAEGSLLGTVRHNGFIPWDDDIDVVLLRKDYDRLMELADKFDSQYFLQNIMTDEGYTNRHAQLRMRGTRAIPKGGMTKRHHYGIFIDIFVMDAMPNSPRAFKHHYADIGRSKLKLKIVSKIMARLPRCIYRWCRENTKALSDCELYKRYEDTMRSVETTERTVTGAMVCQNMRMPVFPLQAYKETRTMKFEHIEVPVPAGYDELLTIEYGNYMTPVKAPTLHGTMTFETKTDD